MSDELGKLVDETAKRFEQAPSFEAFVASSHHRSDIHPGVGHLDHPAAALLDELRLQGANTSYESPPWTADEIQAALDRGPHKSSIDETEFVCQEFAEYIQKGFWTVLPASLAKQVSGLRLAPLGCVPQVGRRPRLICDYTFWGVNQDSDEHAPDSMQFGQALLRIIQRVVYANPEFGPVYLAKIDISDGYYGMPLHWEACSGLAVLLPVTGKDGEPLVAIPLVLPMGWTKSPPFFCAATETIADLANTALQQDMKLSEHPLEEYTIGQDAPSDKWQPLPEEHSARRAWAEALQQFVDVYLDDLLGLTQGSPEQRLRVGRAILHSLDAVFRPIDAEDSSYRQTPASIKKLEKGDGRFLTRKEVLGWIIDTVRGTLELTARRHARLVTILDQFPRTRDRVSVKEWYKVLGELRSMQVALPGSGGLFGPLQAVLQPKQT